jgi:hypothetical protein
VFFGAETGLSKRGVMTCPTSAAHRRSFGNVAVYSVKSRDFADATVFNRVDVK